MTECPEGLVAYQARTYLSVDGASMDVWEVRCLPGTHEVGVLVAIHFLVPQDAEGNFPSPVVVPSRCCGQQAR